MSDKELKIRGIFKCPLCNTNLSVMCKTISQSLDFVSSICCLTTHEIIEYHVGDNLSEIEVYDERQEPARWVKWTEYFSP